MQGGCHSEFTQNRIASAGTHIDPSPHHRQKVHVVVEVSANVTGSVALKEGATVTGGTSLTPVCNNRTENKAASSTAKFDPTVTVAGTQLFSVQLPTGGATKKVLSLVRDEGEIVLRRATTYTITYTAGADSTDCSIAIEFYEA
jgi:hypothetical protein